MTARKQLFVAVKNKLGTITGIELVDYDRNQFGDGKGQYPNCFTACLIHINRIDWEAMTNNHQIGNTTITIKLYCKDGWMHQFKGSTDSSDGLIEIDLIDNIVEELQFLHGNGFAPLELVSDEPDEISPEETTSYSITFKTIVTRTILPLNTVKLKPN